MIPWGDYEAGKCWAGNPAARAHVMIGGKRVLICVDASTLNISLSKMKIPLGWVNKVLHPPTYRQA